MTQGLRQAIALLSLDNAGLGEHLRKASAANPALAVWFPAGDDREEIAAPSGGLHAHLGQQIRLAFSKPQELAMGFAFAEALEPWGWLSRPVAEIAAERGWDLADARAVLARLQEIEPAGLFARDLAECLRLQARAEGQLDVEMDCVLTHLDRVARGEIEDLARAHGFAPEALGARLTLLRRFDPKPGLQLAPAPAAQGLPDLIIRQTGGDWEVSLNPDALPEIRLLDGLDPAARQAARRLRDAVARRNESVLGVARVLAAFQSAYLGGAPAPAPLTLTKLARMSGLHRSSVSRITAAVTARTPMGVLPLRALLGRPVRGRGDLSVAALETGIATLIAEENPARPLSDARIAARLAEAGLAVNRRTVAKYRAGLGLGAAPARRREGRKEPGANSDPSP